MKFNKIVVSALGCVLGLGTLSLQANPAPVAHDCSAMSPEMQQFAGQLTPLNRQIFCGKFTDGQRASAMQMAKQSDEKGMMMTPDMAVSKVAESNGAALQQKASRGCPSR